MPDPSLKIFEGLPGDANSPPYFRRATTGGVDQRAKIDKVVHCLNCLTFNREGIRLGKEVTQRLDLGLCPVDLEAERSCLLAEKGSQV